MKGRAESFFQAFMALIRTAIICAMSVGVLHIATNLSWLIVIPLGAVVFLVFAEGRVDGMYQADHVFAEAEPVVPLSDMTDRFTDADIDRIRIAEGKPPINGNGA